LGEILLEKIQKIFKNTMQKILPKYSLPLPRKTKKNEMISLNYDVNDHIHSNSKIYLAVVNQRSKL